jgi:hypothetical protein
MLAANQSLTRPTRFLDRLGMAGQPMAPSQKSRPAKNVRLIRSSRQSDPFYHPPFNLSSSQTTHHFTLSLQIFKPNRNNEKKFGILIG